MAEFTVNGESYRNTKLNAVQQFHVARRLAPLLTKSSAAFLNQPGNLDDMAQTLEPVFDALGAMDDDVCNYVLRTCLASVQKNVGGQWITVWNPAAGRLQFDDLDLATMLQLTVQVIQDNLGTFLQGTPSTSNEPAGQVLNGR